MKAWAIHHPIKSGVAVLLFILGIGLYLSVDIWTRMAKESLRAAGLPSVSFQVTNISTSGIAFSGIRIGDGLGLKIPNLEAFFLWEELFKGKIGTLNIDGLQLNGEVKNGKLSFGELDELLFAQPTTPDGRGGVVEVKLPFRSLHLNTSNITIKTGTETLNLSLSGLVERVGQGGIEVKGGLLSVTTPWGNVSGQADASLSPNKKFTAQLAVDQGHYEYGGMTGQNLFGMIQVQGQIDDLKSFVGDGQLGVKTLNLPYLGDSRALLTLDLAKGQFDGHFILKPENDQWVSGELFTSIDLTQKDLGAVQVSAKVIGNDVAKVFSSTLVTGGQLVAEVSVSSTIGEVSNLAQNALTGKITTFPDVFFSSTLDNLNIDPCHVLNGKVALEFNALATGIEVSSRNGGELQVIAAPSSVCEAFDVQAKFSQVGERLARVQLSPETLGGSVRFAVDVEGGQIQNGHGTIASQFSSPYPLEDWLTGQSTLNGQLSGFGLTAAQLDGMLNWRADRGGFSLFSFDCLKAAFRSAKVPELDLRVDNGEACLSSKQGLAVAFADGSLSGDVRLETQKNVTVSVAQKDRFQVSKLTAEFGPEDWAITLDSVSDLARPARLIPLSVRAKGSHDAQNITFVGDVKGGQSLTLEFDGTHNIQTRNGQLTARLVPLRFAQKDLRLDDVSPKLAGEMAAAEGGVMAVVKGNWTAEKACGQADVLIRDFVLSPTSKHTAGRVFSLKGGQIVAAGQGCVGTEESMQSGSILLENVDVIDPSVELRHLNTVIKLSHLWPPVTDGVQDLAFGVLQVGVPLTNGTASFELTPHQRLSVSNVSLDWAGGTVKMAPFESAQGEVPQSLEVTFESLQLSDFLNLFQVHGLAGEGVLEGKLPIQFIDDEFRIHNGQLAALGPGVLSYVPKDPVGTSAQIAVEALSDFHYSKLSVGVDGGANSQARIQLNVEGHNPTFYDGFPVVLEFNIKGQIGRIMNDGLAAYKVPDHIRDRMNRFGE